MFRWAYRARVAVGHGASSAMLASFALTFSMSPKYCSAGFGALIRSIADLAGRSAAKLGRVSGRPPLRGALAALGPGSVAQEASGRFPGRFGGLSRY